MNVRNPLKTALHHWWPRGLMNFWADQEGQLTRLSVAGDIERSAPANFAATTNAHHVKLAQDSPWNATFEPDFDAADDAFPWLIEWLMTRESLPSVDGLSFERRFLGEKLATERRAVLAECVASLIVRSPSLRARVKLGVERMRADFGMANPEAPKALISANLQRCLETYTHTLKTGGKFLLVFSDSAEFIFGDGFLHNFRHVDPPMRPRCVVPLTPEMTLLYQRPMSYRCDVDLVTMRMTAEEVHLLNEIVQVYSCRYLHFRAQRPRVSQSFSCGEFRQFEYDQHPWLERIFEEHGEYDPRDVMA